MKKGFTLNILLLLLTLSTFGQTTIISNGSTWKYIDNGTDPGANWYGNAFNDASWSSGAAEFGYGDGDETTLVNACGTVTANPGCSNKYITTYFRQTFSVSSVASYSAFTASLRRDDGIVLYVNGVEVYRNNMPTGTITYTTPASAACADDGTLVLTSPIAASLIATGTNVIAAEIHQNAGSSSDLSFVLSLTGNTVVVVPATVMLFPYGSTWNYFDNGTDPGASWYSTSFNDASWSSGPSELGYGDGDEATLVNACGTVVASPSCANKYMATYFRRTFTVGSTTSYTSYVANLRRDDGIVLYVNGTEVYRNNMPAGTITYTTPASAACSDDGTLVLSPTIPASLITTGTNVIAAEIHQNAGSSSDLSFQINLVAVTNSVAVPTPTIVKGPYLVVGTPTSMVVRWETDLATDSKVMFGTSAASLSSVETNTTVSVTHTVQLSGLSPYTRYYYSIGSNTLVTQGDTNNYFVTSPLPGTAGKYRFWMVGDCGNASTNQVNCMNQYLAYTGTTVTNGMLLSGDNAYSSGTNAEYNAEFFGIYQGKALKKMPLWSAPGNHDYNNGASTATTVPYFTHFTTPRNGEAGGIPSNNAAYYSFDYGNIHFLSLDSYGTTGASQKMYDTTGAQVTWIKQDLAANTKKWVIAYWHHPPYTMGSHNSDSESDLAAIRSKFIKILERYKVDMIICGHSHDYERSKLMSGHYGNEASFSAATHNLSTSSGLYDGSSDSCPYLKDSVNSSVGTVYVVSGSAGQLGGQQTAFPHNAMHYSNATNGGTFILDIEDNKLEAKWLCADGAIRDKFTMYKDVKSVKQYTLQPNQNVTLSASWPGSYNWSPIAGAATTKTVSISSPSSSVVWVKDPNNCVADTFKLNILPAVSFSASLPYCSASPVQFSDLSTNGASSWLWSVSPSASASSFTAQNPSFTFATPGTYTVTLISANQHGAGTAYTQTLAVLASPVLSVSASALTVCAQQSLTLSASGASSYSWSSGGSSANVTVTPVATTVYSVNASNGNGCSAMASQSIFVNSLPAITAVMLPASASLCAGSTLNLSGAGASTYSWTGGVVNGISFTPASSASYTLTGADANNCRSSIIVSVTVVPLPVLTIAASPGTVACQGATLALTASGAGSYSWSGGISNGVPFTPASSSVYTVSGSLNGCQSSITQSITLNALPVPAISGAGTLCAGQAASLAASGANTYSWNTGATSSLVSVSPSSTSVYTLTGISAAGCQANSTATVSVLALPVVTIATSPSGTVCAGTAIVLNASGALSHTWTSGVQNNIAFTPAVTANYTVTGIGANGCAAKIVKNIVVNPLPGISVWGGGPVCAGQSASLSAQGAPTFTWSTGSNNAVILVSPANTTSYSVTGSSANGCVNTVTTLVTINPLPTVSVNSGTICAGDLFTIIPSGAGSYTISGGTYLVSPLASTSYSIMGSSTLNCVSASAAVASVVVNPVPVVLVLQQKNTVCAGETVTLTASGAGSYTWNNSQTGASITISPLVTTSYSVTGTNAFNCSSAAAITQSVSACTGINGLSGTLPGIKLYPNPNKGHFTVEAGGEGEYVLMICNALGETVLEKKIGTGANDISMEAAHGIYLYQVMNGSGIVEKGKIVVE